MQLRALQVPLLFAAGMAASLVASATTIVPPRNLGQLARMSRSVALARASHSWVEDRGLPVTVTAFELVQPVGGASTQAVFLVEVPGGALEERAAWIAGAPRFSPGKAYLLFLVRAANGRWRPPMLAYGLLEEVPRSGLLRPLPEGDEIELLGAVEERVESYDEAALLRHIAAVMRGGHWDARNAGIVTRRTVDKLHTKPALCEFQRDPGDNRPLRKFGYETGATMSIVHTTPGQTGIADGGVSAVQQGVAAWANHPDSVIGFQYGGSRARAIGCSAGSDLDQGGVVFNDPCSDIADLAGCTGTLAFGGSFYNPSASPLYDGEPWHDVTAPFVVVNNGTQCVGETGFKEMLTHELGHTQGFGHHLDPAATMSPALKNDGRGASLQATDRACASYAYHTFLDVSYSHSAWREIEAIENRGVTTGCGGGLYCPSDPVSRAQMAVFLLRARDGGGYVPPACTTPRFSDVPCSLQFAAFINELARRGITAGCGNGTVYCPTASTTRAQMALFLLRTIEGSGYSPPPCTAPMFADVPCSHPFAAWINEAARRGITTGCGGGNFCPAAVVTRAQMAIFLVRGFGLPTP